MLVHALFQSSRFIVHTVLYATTLGVKTRHGLVLRILVGGAPMEI